MSDGWFLLAEAGLTIGAFAGFVVWQLVTLRRDKRKTQALKRQRRADG